MHNTIDELGKKLIETGYIADQDLIATIVLMEQLHRPVLIEGEAGVGKTEIGKKLADIFHCRLIRLQCYDGLDTNAAVYEWNYTKQLLAIKLKGESEQSADIFSEEYILERPLLQAIREEKPPVLLIDEIDRTDEAFEAYLLELLADYQITIPELGTIRAKSVPRVILTSNGTRELSDALRRRCLYHYMDYPQREKELQIIRTRIPGIAESLSTQIVDFVQLLRKSDLRKRPGIAETLDWAAALTGLGVRDLMQDEALIYQTRTCLLKTQDDTSLLDEHEIHRMLEAAI